MRNLFDRYLDFAYRRPAIPLAIALGLTGLAVFGASKIELRTDIRELLPRDYRSIRDLERIERRVGGMGALVFAIESDDPAANIRFVERLASELRKLPESEVRWVDYHVREERDFFERNKLLYADLSDLRTFKEELAAKIAAERKKHDPLDLELDAPEPAKKAFDVEAYKKKYEAKLAEFDRYPGGYYVGEGGKLASVTVRVPGSATGINDARRLVTKLEHLVTLLQPKTFHASMKVGITGDMRTAIEEYEATKDDLVFVSTVCMALVIFVVLLFFRGPRSLFVLGLPLLMGVAWTFGITAVAVGSLNASTMFLASIIAGNGVNFGIILLARYYEERRSGRASRESFGTAAHYTARATGIAALAAAIAYGSLLATDFRGFNQFGFIGGAGMILCWLATFLVMPPLLALCERIVPFRVKSGARKDSRFAAGFAAIATRWPRAMVVFGLLSFAASASVGADFLAHDPFLYNFRLLRNVEARDVGVSKLRDRVAPVAHSNYAAPPGMILLAERLEQVPRLEAALKAGNVGFETRAKRPMGDVATIFSLIPKNQPQKLVVLREIRDLLGKNTLKWLTPEQRKDVERMKPADDLRELTIADLPAKLARSFTDVDGVRGLIVYAAMGPHMSAWDGKDLIQFASIVRDIELGAGERIHASGHPVIFADMISAVLKDGPRAALFSFVGVLLLIVIAIRRVSMMLLTLGVLVLGLSWLVGAMGGWDLLVRSLTDHGYELSERFVNAVPKVNFLNFIVIPLTIGIGVDYGVNVALRYVQEGEGSMRRVLASTGGAVVLCSLTTIIGYSALFLSRNLALVSFGKLANLGEIACLLAALSVLPAAVIWLEQRRARRDAKRKASTERI